MSYEYDVFFSYKRHLESDQWHATLKEKLTHWLEMELNRKVEIFIDTEDIKTGERWRQKLSSALKSSRCILCIWSPMYFRSKWCVSEWATFEERGRICGVDLVSPARYHDGRHYPSLAKDRQSPDFSEYASIMPRFWETESAVEFEQRYIKPFAGDLAAIIRAAPEFDPEFPIKEASDDLILEEKSIDRISGE